MAYDNTSFGLNLGAGSGYCQNVLNDNNSNLAQVAGGIEICTNVCGGNTVCP